jgi:arylsulfatase A-like enzyme
MSNPKNILVVFSDQHRWCDLGCAGNREVISPNFDAFAQQGTCFNSAFSNSPLCVPARGTLLTGLHGLKHRAIANDLPVDSSVESLGSRLRTAGYQTGYVGKWHLAGVPRDQAVDRVNRLGFDYWKVRQCSHDYLHPCYHDENNQLHVREGYEPEVQTDLALDFLKAQTPAQPWGLVLSWGPPHNPYEAVPQEYRDLYDAKGLTLRGNVPDQLQPFAGAEDLPRAELRESLAGYYAHITALDKQFGRIVRQLKESGQWENTVVLYTSDHGDLLGSHNMLQKQMPHEESSHVPLLIGGGVSKLGKGLCDGLISLVDIVPTVLSFLGIDYESTMMDGTDLSRLLVDPKADGADAVYLYSLLPCHYAVRRGDPAWRAIRTRQYTFALNVDTGQDWLLFDNTKDPLQQNNLLESKLDIDLNYLRAQLIDTINQFDANCSSEELIQQEQLVAAWNLSQRHFNYPEFKL